MSGNTLITSAFWVSDKRNFPTLLDPNSSDGRAFYDLYEGEAKHLGWMDLVLLKSIIKKHHITHIILQDLNLLGKIAQKTRVINVCEAYDYEHFVINTLSGKKNFKHCKPYYKEVVFGGWDSTENDDEFHVRAQSYMRYLLVHTKVNSITCMNNKIKLTAYLDVFGNVSFKTEPNL